MQYKNKQSKQLATAQDVLQYAIRALSRRALTAFELETRLRKRNASEEDIKNTIAKLRTLKFLNDQIIAERIATETRIGSFGVHQKLRARGLGKNLIEDALQNRDPDLDEAGAKKILERYATRFSGERGHQKAFAFLVRRGFPSSVIARVLKENKQS